MGGGKSKAPSAPNYTQVAKTEAAENRKTAEELTGWNRPDQNNPFGNMSWEKDAAGNWTQNETWDPRVMAGYDQAFGLKDAAMGDLANQGAFKGPDQVQYDPNSGQAAGDAMYNSYMSRAGRDQGDAQQKMQTQLRQQGLQPGTESYDRAYKNLLTSQGDVNAKAQLDSQVFGGNEARANFASALSGQQQNYGQDMNTWQSGWDRAGAASNMLNSQYRPTFTGFSGATGYNPADLMGASQAQFQSGMDKSNASAAKKGNTMNTAATVGSAAMM